MPTHNRIAARAKRQPTVTDVVGIFGYAILVVVLQALDCIPFVPISQPSVYAVVGPFDRIVPAVKRFCQARVFLRADHGIVVGVEIRDIGRVAAQVVIYNNLVISAILCVYGFSLLPEIPLLDFEAAIVVFPRLAMIAVIGQYRSPVGVEIGLLGNVTAIIIRKFHLIPAIGIVGRSSFTIEIRFRYFVTARIVLPFDLVITSLSGRRSSDSVEVGQAFLQTPRIVGLPVLMHAVGICSWFARDPEICPSQRIAVFVSREDDFLVVSLLPDGRILLSVVITGLSHIALVVVVGFDQMDSVLIDRRAPRAVKELL